MHPAKLIIALETESLRAEAIRALEAESGTLSWAQMDPRNWSALLDGLSSEQPDALLIEMSSFDGELGTAIRQVRSRTPQTKVIAMHAHPDPHSIMAAMRAGASEFVHSPLADTLVPALARIRDAVDPDAPRRGKLVAFLSAKGGCGATTLACHVAPELQKQTGGSVLLADFDFTSGVIGFLMKATSTYSVLDVVSNLSRLDGSLWKAMISESRPGLSILPAPASISHGQYPDENEFKKVLEFMRTQHDWTVIDLGRSLTRTARAVLEEVDELFLVSTLEVIALHGLKTIVRGVSQDAANMGKLHLVLNRTPKMMDITVEELQKILGQPLYATLPNDYPSLYDSYASGTLLAANSRLAGHFARFAGRIAGKQEPKPTKKRFAIF